VESLTENDKECVFTADFTSSTPEKNQWDISVQEIVVYTQWILDTALAVYQDGIGPELVNLRVNMCGCPNGDGRACFLAREASWYAGWAQILQTDEL
jgi:hypothetical protein